MNMPCGHDESNRDITVETRTVICRMCDLEDRRRDAELREKELIAERDGAMNTAKIAVERHAELKAELDTARASLAESKNLLSECLESGVLMLDTTQAIRRFFAKNQPDNSNPTEPGDAK